MVYSNENEVTLQFKLYNNTTGEILDIEESYEFSIDMHVGDGLEPFRMHTINIPEFSRLNKPYPNPFNPTTKISYSIKEPGNIEISIYDIQGRKVDVLHSGWLDAGSGYEFTWNASSVSSGKYFAVISAPNGFTDTVNMTLIK